jgi:hypothetical protein
MHDYTVTNGSVSRRVSAPSEAAAARIFVRGEVSTTPRRAGEDPACHVGLTAYWRKSNEARDAIRRGDTVEMKTKAGRDRYDLDCDVAGVIIDTGTESAVLEMDRPDERCDPPTSLGVPNRCQIVGRELRLWPIPDAEYVLVLVGPAHRN